MPKTLLSLVLAMPLLAASAATAAPTAAGPNLSAVVVVTADDAATRAGVDVVTSAGGQARAVWRDALHGFAAVLPAAALPRLRLLHGVRSVEPDAIITTATTQSSPTWGLDRIDQRSLPLDHAFHYT